MRKPYFEIEAQCRNDACKMKIRTWRKKVSKVGESGQEYTIEHVVCPECKMWANIYSIKEVKDET